MNKSLNRNLSLDVLRVLACYLVIQVHAGEPFYIGEDGVFLRGEGAFWVNVYNTLGRAAVPLFIMMTGYFLLPVKSSMSDFFKKRFTRILIPFVVWCVVYAFLPFFTGQADLQTVFLNILRIPVNYGTEIGHLWYVYMLIGLYLCAPVISPWIQTVSRRGLEFYLSFWIVSLCLPYIHLVFPEVWGECYWNVTPMLYYFSGFLGYAILGYYAKVYWSKPHAWDIPAGLLLVAIGYAITFGGFAYLGERVTFVPEAELTWSYETINVAMMGAGLFLLVKRIRVSPDSRWAGWFTDISLKSYGIYLVHILCLELISPYIVAILPDPAAAIPVVALCTFIASWLLVKLISLLPGSKYLVG